MKKTTIIAFFICALSLMACAKNKQPIAYDKLPNPVQTEFTKFFAQDQVQYITSEKEFRHHEYTFVMSDGSKVEYDEKGRLREIENKAGVKLELIPEKIKEYVHATFPNAIITGYTFESSKQEVEINDDIDLVFDKHGRFLRIDD